MMRVFAVSLLLILMAYFGNRWINDYEVPQKSTREVSILEEVQIRIFDGKGEEWKVYGSKARLEGSKVLIEDIKLQSEETVLNAKEGSIDRNTGEGHLEGNVILHTKEGTFSTDRAELRLKDGIAYGKGSVSLKSSQKFVEGKGWQVEFKPLRVIINQAKVKLQ